MNPNTLGLILFDGAGVGFAFPQIHCLQRVQNLPALHLKLACQIVDSNLTHPPLFVVLLPG